MHSGQKMRYELFHKWQEIITELYSRLTFLLFFWLIIYEYFGNPQIAVILVKTYDKGSSFRISTKIFGVKKNKTKVLKSCIVVLIARGIRDIYQFTRQNLEFHLKMPTTHFMVR